MKRIAAIICLLSLTWNSGLACVGGLLICEHENGDEHMVTRVTHEEEDDSHCGHGHEEKEQDLNARIENCNPCEDTEVAADEASNATLQTKRLILKAPLSVVSTAIPLFIPAAKSTCDFANAAPRAPPTIAGATFEFSSTVRILC